MTAAEKLKKEMEQKAPITKKQFIESVTDAIRRNGRFSFCVNARVENAFSLTGGASIPLKWLEVVSGWAREEGFNITRVCNYYGVPEYDITL